MTIEHHSNRDTVTLKDEEIELITNEVVGLNTIMGLAFGDLEAFDRYGGNLSIITRTGEPTGIGLMYAIYGEPQFNNATGSFEYETINRIIINNEFVTILLTSENTIREIQTNIHITQPYHIYQWLNNVYRLIQNIFDNDYDYLFHSNDDNYKYVGPEEAAEIRRMNKELRRKR